MKHLSFVSCLYYTCTILVGREGGMSLRWGAVFLLSLATGLAQEDHCQVDNIDKWDCAPDQASCTAAGCCWVPATTKVSWVMVRD